MISSSADDAGLDGLQPDATSTAAVKRMQMNRFIFMCASLGNVDRQVQNHLRALWSLADEELVL